MDTGDRESAARQFIARYHSYRMFAEIGFPGYLGNLDCYEAEAFELIYVSYRKVENEQRKKAAREARNGRR